MMLFLNHVSAAFVIANLLCFGFLRCDDQEFKLLKGRQIGDDLNGCPAENSNLPVLLPHPHDCSKFYICDSGLAHLKECQPGLHFNSKIKVCDYPRNAGCGKELPKGRQIGDDLSVCPAENSNLPVLLPHPDDCSKFYICDSGLAHLKECQSGLHFNTRINACDYPRNAGCDKELPKGRETGNDLSICPAENSNLPVLLPHPDDCGKFYICDSGSAHLKECQPGLHFNTRIKACDYPRNAGCDKELPKGRETGNDLSICPAENSNLPVLLPHPDDCGKFYICDSGLAHLKECQSGLHFNTRINACDYPRNAGCDKELPKGRETGNDLSICPAENSNLPVLLPHPDDCGKFYICDSGSAHLKECQPGLHFNTRIKACDYPRNAGCDKGMSVALSGVPSPFCPAANGKTPIFFRHSTNCSVYYMCGNGLAYEFVCPSRLHFNLRKKVCDYEWTSGCENSNK